jgi:hypothetical protein
MNRLPNFFLKEIRAQEDQGGGGKEIRTPDFQLAKLALYQLSYTPIRPVIRSSL